VNSAPITHSLCVSLRAAPANTVQFLKTLAPYLSPGVIQTLATSFIVPRLQKAVEQWNPRVDAVPIDSWVCTALFFLTTLQLRFAGVAMALSAAS